MKITIGGNVIEGTPEELAEYFAITEDLAKVDTCEDACCEDIEPETIAFEGAEYRKGDREAREGDVVILRDTGGDNFTIGKPYKVVEFVRIRGSIGVSDLYREPLRRTRETVEVYEPVTVEKLYEPKVGDIVVVTEPVGSNNVRVGDTAVVREVDTDDTARVNPPNKIDRDNWVSTYKLRPATAEEIAQRKGGS